MSFPRDHFNKTAELARSIDPSDVARWLLNEGYYPEQYVLPPSFKVDRLVLQAQPYNRNLIDPTRRNLLNISFPKSTFTSRVFSVMHPWNYHDIVFHLIAEWPFILDHLFSRDQRIFSYSFPIPVNARNRGSISPLRSGRMIYEWIAMAEGDLVVEAHKYKLLVRSDVANFYNSIYTHSIPWALHGRDEARGDAANALVGNKIDRLIQYANDGRTNGIAIGPALSDIISEIVLTKVDLNVSNRLKDVDFVGTHFKDDYRILCNSETDGKEILKVLAEELTRFNLCINETKTRILELPTGLYREHDRAYFPHSLKRLAEIDFRTFEQTLLKVIDIHRSFVGTNLLEKFFGELFDDEYLLKVKFATNPVQRHKQILKTFSLMIMVTRESEKTLCHVLAVLEAVYNLFWRQIKVQLKDLVEHELKYASERGSAFSVTWYLFFARYLSLNLPNIGQLVSSEMRENAFVKSMISSTQKIFSDTGISLYRKPRNCRGFNLAKQCAVFNRDREQLPELHVWGLSHEDR